MAAPAVIRSGVGFRHLQVLAIAADGYPAATTTIAYEGVTVSGAKTLVLEDPLPRAIDHMGDDRIFQQDVLPPNSAMTGTVNVAKTNDTLDAVLTDDISFSVGEAQLFGIGTDNKGDENQVVVLAFRQTLDTSGGASDGLRRWEGRLFPKAYLIPTETGFDENPEDRQYALRPQFATQHVWGVDFSTAVEGFDRAQGLRAITQYKPKLIAFNGDATVVTFLFPTAYPAADTNKVAVWVDGTLTVPDAVTVTNFELSTATPAADANIVVWYEVA